MLGATSSRPEVSVHMIGQVRNPRLEVGGPTAHWLGPETLVELTVEGRNFMALANSGSQVNTITPTLVQQYGFPVLPLEDLVDYPVNLVGLGRMRTSPLRFVILHVQVRGVAGYDKDAVFLVVPDESNFGQRVPLVMGTCTISRLINVIHESEIDNLAMPWSTASLAQLLSCQLGTVVPSPEGAETQEEGAYRGSPELNVDELVMVQESIHLGQFQTEIIEGWVKPLLGSTFYVMITPLKVEGQQCETKQLPLGLMSFMPILTSRMATEECPWWSEMCLTAKSSSRRACLWHGLCLQCWCHLRSSHQRWKLPWVKNLDQNPCW